MRYFLFGPLLFALIFTDHAYAMESCSRIAIINFQEVLVDANASEKGEGLRYHLEKDPVAKEYLNTYQNRSSIHWPNALLGTAGSALLLSGFFTSNTEKRQIYMISGAATILVNFLIARTIEVSNEANLTKAIEEYNKRNLPKIFFNQENNLQGNSDFPSFKIGLAKGWSF